MNEETITHWELLLQKERKRGTSCATVAGDFGITCDSDEKPMLISLTLIN